MDRNRNYGHESNNKPQLVIDVAEASQADEKRAGLSIGQQLLPESPVANAEHARRGDVFQNPNSKQPAQEQLGDPGRFRTQVPEPPQVSRLTASKPAPSRGRN